MDQPLGQGTMKNRSDVPLSVLNALFVTMMRIRLCEEVTAEELIGSEIKCPVHLGTGQEAIPAGVCANLLKNDYLFGGHRFHGAYLAKGGDMKLLMAEMYGKRTGCSGGKGGSMHLIAPDVGILGSVPILAATISLAVGTAMASKLRRDGRVTVSFFGDGATEEGTCHESLNLAAHRKLPILFVCENNFLSCHMHLLETRARDNIIQSADAHGMPGIVMDGNDVVEVYQVSAEAISRARSGHGPTLLECRTYRWRGHVGASLDLEVGLDRKHELPKWREKDPIERLKKILVRNGMGQADFDTIAAKAEEEVRAAIAFARESPYPDEAELLTNVFKAGDGRDQIP